MMGVTMLKQLELFPQLDASIIRAYRNLHTGQISLLDKASGLVVGHCDAVRLVPHYLQDSVKCIVNQAGRARVLRERKKYVHAFIEGAIERVAGFVSYKDRSYTGVRYMEGLEAPMSAVTYNPYKAPTFTDKSTGAPIEALQQAIISADGSIQGVTI